MTDTEFNMVAKTVVPGGSPPSTTAGSTGDTVLNETAFDVSEIFETVNPLGPETRQRPARQTRARMSDIAGDIGIHRCICVRGVKTGTEHNIGHG